MAISDQLKDAVRRCGLPAYKVAKNAGISGPALSRFLVDDPVGHRDIRLETTADKLAEFFGMTLSEPRQIPQPAKAKKRPRNGRRQTAASLRKASGS